MLLIFVWAAFTVVIEYRADIGGGAEAQKTAESLPEKTAYVAGISVEAWDEEHSAAIADVTYKKENGNMGAYHGWVTVKFGDGENSEMSYKELEKTMYGVSVSLSKNERVEIGGLEKQSRTEEASRGSANRGWSGMFLVALLTLGLNALAAILFIGALRARQERTREREQEEAFDEAARLVQEMFEQEARTTGALESAPKAKELEEKRKRSPRAIRA